MRALLLAALLSACGSSTPAPAPAPSESAPADSTPRDVAPPYTSSVPCDASVPFACAFAIMTDFKSRMCACTSKSCAQTLVKELNEYGKVPPPAADRAATMSDADSQRMYQLGVDTNDCAKRALTSE